jgi:hypothetical protein
MSSTFERIGSITVPKAGINEIKFSNIPQNYTDLKFLVSVRSDVMFGQTGTSQYDALVPVINNNIVSTDYSGKNFYYFNNTNGSAVTSGETQDNSRQIGFIQGNLATPNAFSNSEIYMPNYSATNIEKIVAITTSNASNLYGSISCHAISRFLPTAAVTSFAIRLSWGTKFIEDSHVTMYGIRKE